MSPGCRGPSVIREGQRGFTEIGKVKCRHQKCLRSAPSAAHGPRHMSLHSATVQELHLLPMSHPQMLWYVWEQTYPSLRPASSSGFPVSENGITISLVSRARNLKVLTDTSCSLIYSSQSVSAFWSSLEILLNALSLWPSLLPPPPPPLQSLGTALLCPRILNNSSNWMHQPEPLLRLSRSSWIKLVLLFPCYLYSWTRLFLHLPDSSEHTSSPHHSSPHHSDFTHEVLPPVTEFQPHCMPVFVLFCFAGGQCKSLHVPDVPIMYSLTFHPNHKPAEGRSLPYYSASDYSISAGLIHSHLMSSVT